VGAEITTACGRTAYRRWRLGLELGGALWAVRTGQRVEGFKSARRMARFLPGSAPHMAIALGAALLGARAYARIAGAGQAVRRLTGGRA